MLNCVHFYTLGEAERSWGSEAGVRGRALLSWPEKQRKIFLAALAAHARGDLGCAGAAWPGSVSKDAGRV